MKRNLVDILACPVCQGDLELNVAEENEIEIVSGSLRCPRCKVDYPVRDTVPNFLPPEWHD